ncbi:hypothetical protein [Pseudogemmobacter sp. W21_MBD1_M6]|uniref:hypothetical protein n=1 Tax=Pseudogemmobacter sp. W21_MBD1_M6 TaxID=3240271 RepID=UPI003F9E2403
MKNIIMATTAIISLSGTVAFADSINFDQGTMAINELILEQTLDGGDLINLNIKGDMTSVVIKQSGTTTSSGNIANVDIFANTTATSLTAFTDAASDGAGNSILPIRDKWKTFSATFDGDNNTIDFDIGAAITAAGYNDINVDIAVTGDGNSLTHSFTNGLDGETLQFGGIVTGDDNTVVTTIGAVGNVAFNYNIQGSTNGLTATLAGAKGDQTVGVALTGDSNTWTVTSNATVGIMDVAASGSLITGTNTQGGSDSELQFDIIKAGAAAFAVTTTQTGANSFADVTINADDGGAFTLTQSSANARYLGTLNIASGGAVTITQ